MTDEEKAELEELYENSVWWHNRFNAVQRDYENLQTKINKAIEILHDDNYCHIEKLQKINEILGDKEIEEIPLFDGTLEQLNNLSIIGDKDNE